ncbi:MAG: DUF3710 domain-containing protein [Rhodococcus sp.]|nr:DUF3710 domain-containing protein [Rhodococcus sp. (in: high G+C Gram-positive bacteria)]
MFGRRKKKDADNGYAEGGFFGDEAGVDEGYYAEGDYADGAYGDAGYEDAENAGGGYVEGGHDDLDHVEDSDAGPYDSGDFEPDADLSVGVNGQRLDLGSVLVPMPPGSQLQVEMAPNGSPQAVHVVTQHGRVTVAAYAAPKSPGQWREVAGDLAESLRGDNASVTIENGPWGREILAVTPNADLRFIGVDGYRWMVRCVVAGPSGSNAADSSLVAAAREILQDTVVKRGSDPHPVRTPLPVVLPAALAEQLAQAQQQQMDQQQGAPQQQAQPPQPQPQQQAQPQQAQPPQPQQQRRGESGSAMQQLG